MKWVAVNLSAENRFSLHVPAGCANAWLTTAPNTNVHYYMSELYEPTAERGLRFDDPVFGFRWPTKPAVISEKDLSYPNFDIRSLEI
jgi:dTDP-4-dehydrorhamnose 3,5-epimerase